MENMALNEEKLEEVNGGMPCIEKTIDAAMVTIADAQRIDVMKRQFGDEVVIGLGNNALLNPEGPKAVIFL